MINAAVITVSDSRTEHDDVSGDRLVELLTDLGAEIVERVIVSDDRERIEQTILALTERSDVNLILTTGGTGFAPRDNTPEATLAVIERETPGISEAMRRETAAKTPMAMLSRSVAGIRGKTLIVNLPGSPKAVEECFEVIRPVLKHAVALLIGEKDGHK
jgi:molybdenum cofactor synthesis domain-containing protein